MASGFQTPITIKEAIANIDKQFYLLPSIQRKFVWSSEQIETLFDSIMRGYPINSFMFWEITDKNIKKDFKFYKFLNEYREFFKVNNPDIDVINFDQFYAVIDGQQRLTSIYLGLKGTYAYKLPRKWLVDNEDALPTRRLYINLDYEKLDETNSYEYEFKFMTSSEATKAQQKGHWYLVREILGMSDIMGVVNYSQENALSKHATNVLSKLFDKIHNALLINYYLEDKQDIDSVLDIFIRTNSGGVPLSFSNLLMSITIANWKTEDGSDARKTLADLVQEVFAIGKPGFMISEDFILKTCLVLFKDNIRFSVKNFNSETVADFAQNWSRIRKCIVEVFKMLENWGFNNSSLRAKNAAIPLIYFVYWHHMENDLNKPTYKVPCKDTMRKWLCIATLKGIFGGQTDAILSKIKNVLVRNADKQEFPIREIVEDFKGSDRNFAFDNDMIDRLLETQKDDSICYSILALIYSHLKFETANYHKDHLYPASKFRNKEYLIKLFGSEENVPEVYKDPKYWNSVVNLQLLNGVLNESKNADDLKTWVAEKKVDLQDQLIPANIDLDFSKFKEFYDKRKELLVEKLKSAVTI